MIWGAFTQVGLEKIDLDPQGQRLTKALVLDISSISVFLAELL